MDKNVSKLEHGWSIFSGFLTRLIFFLHGAVSIYFLYKNNNLGIVHSLLAIPLVFLFLEGVITLYYRRGKECKYFWPSGFMYMATIVPIIWILELGLVEMRYSSNATVAVNTTNTTGNIGWKLVDDLRLSNEYVSNKVCEVGIIIGIILGRWLLPSDSISRDQLSAMLLGYVGNGGDILDLLGSTDFHNIQYEIKIAVLCVYSWALFKFALVTTTTIDVNHNEDDPTKGNLHEVTDPSVSTLRQTKDKTGNTNDDQATVLIITQPLQKEPVQGWFKLHEEFVQILITLLMHDGPFLLLRISLFIKIQLNDELYLFFMCKNGIVCFLLTYRLISITCCTAENKYKKLSTEDTLTEEERLQLVDLNGGSNRSIINPMSISQDEIYAISNDGYQATSEECILPKDNLYAGKYNSFASTTHVH